MGDSKRLECGTAIFIDWNVSVRTESQLMRWGKKCPVGEYL